MWDFTILCVVFLVACFFISLSLALCFVGGILLSCRSSSVTCLQKSRRSFLLAIFKATRSASQKQTRQNFGRDFLGRSKYFLSLPLESQSCQLIYPLCCYVKHPSCIDCRINIWLVSLDTACLHFVSICISKMCAVLYEINHFDFFSCSLFLLWLF